jgi:hypothetical protein
MATPKAQNQMKKELGPYSDIEEWIKGIEEFFLSKFGIKLWHIYLFTKMGDEYPILYPYQKNELNPDDIEEIRRFFKNELKMNGGDRKLRSILNELRRKKVVNEVIGFEFYYDISFRINIHISYIKSNEKELFLLNLITIERFGKKTDEIMREATKEIFREINRDEEYEDE